MRKKRWGIRSLAYTILCFSIVIFLGFAFGITDKFEGAFSVGGVLTAFVTIYLTLYP